MPRIKQNTGKRKRSIAVVIITLLLLAMIGLRAYGVYNTAREYNFFINWQPITIWNGGFTQAAYDLTVGAFWLIWAITALAVMVGIYQMQRWGWIMLMLWVGTSLLIGLVRFFNSTALYNVDYFVMATDTVLAYILNQSDVQVIYGIRSSDDGIK